MFYLFIYLCYLFALTLGFSLISEVSFPYHHGADRFIYMVFFDALQINKETVSRQQVKAERYKTRCKHQMSMLLIGSRQYL